MRLEVSISKGRAMSLRAIGTISVLFKGNCTAPMFPPVILGKGHRSKSHSAPNGAPCAHGDRCWKIDRHMGCFGHFILVS
jgi:hypothetical protein